MFLLSSGSPRGSRGRPSKACCGRRCSGGSRGGRAGGGRRRSRREGGSRAGRSAGSGSGTEPPSSPPYPTAPRTSPSSTGVVCGASDFQTQTMLGEREMGAWGCDGGGEKRFFAYIGLRGSL